MVGGGTKLVSLVVVVVGGEVCGVLDITLRLYPGTGGGNSGVRWYILAMEPCPLPVVIMGWGGIA